MVLDVYLIDVTVSINIRSQLVKIETRIRRFTVLAVTANARCLVTSHILTHLQRRVGRNLTSFSTNFRRTSMILAREVDLAAE